MPLNKTPIQQNITSQTGRADRIWIGWFNNIERLLTNIRNDKSIEPASLADADAQNNSIYYSTDQSKLVYKDSGGVINDLY